MLYLGFLSLTEVSLLYLHFVGHCISLVWIDTVLIKGLGFRNIEIETCCIEKLGLAHRCR